jgi:hypothetical protein
MCNPQMMQGLAGGAQPQQMARAGDRYDLNGSTYESVGPKPPAGGYNPNSGDWIKMLPPADAHPGAPNKPPEYWRRLLPGFATS